MTPLRQKLLEATEQRGYSRCTFDTYSVAVKQLIRYCHSPAEDITPKDIQPFFDHLVQTRKLAPSTCLIYWNGIRFFCEKVLKWPEFVEPIVGFCRKLKFRR